METRFNILLYRGYPIDQPGERNRTFLEVCYLLLNGELPTPAELAAFEHSITYHTMVHEQISILFRGFRRDAHPMAVMVGVVGALSAFYHDPRFHRHLGQAAKWRSQAIA